MVEHPIARRLGRRVVATAVDAEIDGYVSEGMLRRVLQRVMDNLTVEELALCDDDLANLVHETAVALARLAKTSLSPNEARLRLEGLNDGRPFHGWKHPELMTPDKEIFGLRLAGKDMYLLSSIERALARLQTLTVQIAEAGKLKPLIAYTLRRGGVHSLYRKTDILLDVFAGRFAVFTTVVDSCLCDLFVDHDEVVALRNRKRPGPIEDPPEYEKKDTINRLIARRYGLAARLKPAQFERLANLNRVRSLTRRSKIPCRDRDVVVRFFHAEDVLGVVDRAHKEQATPMELVAMGDTFDIGPRVVKHEGAGCSVASIARRLNAEGLWTQTGLVWTGPHLGNSLRRCTSPNAPLLALKVPVHGL